MRVLRRVLVLLVVLVVVLVVVDRVSVWGAQRVVADQVADELAGAQVDSAPPEVDIEGAPFLTQVAAGRYQRVTVLLRDVGSAGVQLSRVKLVATGVTAAASTLAGGEGPIDAARVDGTATLGYGAVAGLADVDELELSAGPDGELAVRLPTEVLGEPVVLVGTAELVVAEEPDGAVELRVVELTVEDGGDLPPGAEPVVEDIAQQLALDVPLPPLPYGLTVESVAAEPAGILVRVSAEDVPLAR